MNSSAIGKTILIVVLVLAIALMAGCVPGPNPGEGKGAEPANFWAGLWHGAIMWYSFIVSLFNPQVAIYEVNNNGGWYDFGYLLGAMMFLGGGSGGAAAGASKRS